MNPPSKVLLITFFNEQKAQIDVEYLFSIFGDFQGDQILKIYIYNKVNKQALVQLESLNSGVAFYERYQNYTTPNKIQVTVNYTLKKEIQVDKPNNVYNYNFENLKSQVFYYQKIKNQSHI